jgi:hypothetical protein
VLLSDQAELSSYDGYRKRCKLTYDDGEEEWLALHREKFRWLAPRGRSAGYSQTMKEAMTYLGAVGACLRGVAWQGLPGSQSAGWHQPLQVHVAGGAGMSQQLQRPFFLL